MIMNGNFTKMIYSDEYVVINEIYIHCPLHFSPFCKNKNTVCFKINENEKNIQNMLEIEKKIIELYKNEFNNDKIACYSFNSLFQTEKIKTYSDYNENKLFVIKISGIWDDLHEFGIAYKFMFI